MHLVLDRIETKNQVMFNQTGCHEKGVWTDMACVLVKLWGQLDATGMGIELSST